MDNLDLNLLVALDALLAEGSVTGAARSLGLSASAMSRALTRLRSTTGDPLLVRAGSRLVLTPRATELRDHVHALTRDVRAVFKPQIKHLNVASLDRTFTIRGSEGFVELFSAPLMTAITQVAPRIRLRFASKSHSDVNPLREGLIDLEIGVPGGSAPEVRTKLLFRDDYVGVARVGHPLLTGARMTPERYAACNHVVVQRRDDFSEPVDDVLQPLGLHRAIVVVVPGFPAAMRIARESDLVALVPRSCLGRPFANDHAARLGVESFEVPVYTPEIRKSAMWHPRVDADPAHRWLRETVMSVCQAIYPSSDRAKRDPRSSSVGMQAKPISTNPNVGSPLG